MTAGETVTSVGGSVDNDNDIPPSSDVGSVDRRSNISITACRSVAAAVDDTTDTLTS